MIRVEHITKSYGAQVVLADASFQMGRGERLGLVGRNGRGKTTLLRLIVGEEQPDSGAVHVPRGYRVGYLSQRLALGSGTILDEACRGLADGASGQRYRAEAALMGLGFARDDLARPPSEFSGGYQMRVELARVLVAEPDLLLLDEPTNYLDIVSVRWLARLLRDWKGELIVVTHDRRFMDAVTTHTMAIHRRAFRRIAGPVDKLLEQLGTEAALDERTRLNEQRRREREERFIERFRAKASKASVVQSRIKALERRERIEAPEVESRFALRFEPAPVHDAAVLTASGLSFAHPGGPVLFEGLDLTIEKGDRIAIIGPNGRGKTTLLEVLAGERAPRAGTLRRHPSMREACFAQTHVARLDAARTIEEELAAAGPERSRREILGLCGALLFPGELAGKRIGVLSGGERSRVLLGKLLLRPSNLLLLDEPTNHLDIESVGSLLEAVESFPGAVVIVTHDELILERLARRLVVFDGGRAFTFEGGYGDFLDRVGWQSEADERAARARGPSGGPVDGRGASRGGSDAPPGGPRDGAAPAAPSRRPERERRRLRAELVAERGRITGPLERRMAELETLIDRLEQRVSAHDAEMADAAQRGDGPTLVRLAALAKRDRRAIDEHFAELERVSDELDRAREQFAARFAELE